MGKQKKNGGKKHTIEKVLLATAIIELLRALFDLLSKLTE